ncbi:MAG: NAD(P)-dependent alcohol dehydrogenase [Legionella sp.]|nr:NAD(P)-dependent alcohol dehydrogenase [Legionella sp.]
MIKVQGYAALHPKAPLTPFAFERQAVGPHDVFVEILYCGICHSDIHQVRDEWGGSSFPMVPGHEIVGIVSQVGKAVTRFKPGDSVGVGCMVDSCRTCQSCHQGLEQYCEEGFVGTYNSKDRRTGLATQGGYSTNIIVDEAFCLQIPNNLPLDATAPLLCAGITLYSPLSHWKAGPGKRIAIIGLGGLGHIGIKIAHAMGANVTVLSHSANKEADSRALGADDFYNTSNSKVFQKLERHFDLIICTVSVPLNWNAYFNLLKREGTFVLLGIPPDQVPISAATLILHRRNLAGSLIGGVKETQEMLDFCGKHNITADIELIPIQQVNEAYERVLKSDVRYRFVIDMASLKKEGKTTGQNEG